ncbi:ankyrin repeat domain-containing protein [Lentzea sp. BCCO 10_0856]|uniref:Ankyrin repeat domain-containing protein n=1 Tax=Lentzea miocenica TaxID=3095431 RepID=A0ABU4THD1_9PSEU|nr:ankyrin repeat domain-containing protein [Lentzea sp. BCCO 10_0856]MDX8037606.1 ankyrin repeat domain-containing protein [Lentzea sp. BCCO 10_0856]
MTLRNDEPLALAVTAAIRAGDLAALRGLLADNDGLATARILDDSGSSRTLLHVLTDWPARCQNGAQTVELLVAAGAEVNARFEGPHTETPLHWAASADDVVVLDALLDAGADIDADGAVIGGGTPLADARAFAQWHAARRLVERGAAVTLIDAATLGLRDHVERLLPAAANDIDAAFWGACHGGQRECAEYLLARGANVNWLPPWEHLTPLGAALRNDFDDLAAWLRDQGGS